MMIFGSHSQLIKYWRFRIVRLATTPKASVFDELGMRLKINLQIRALSYEKQLVRVPIKYRINKQNLQGHQTQGTTKTTKILVVLPLI